ncbi:hypothetical protein PMW_61 [Pseudomonas phage phiPMW]|uniref:Uncharacterized protein n=1 Tax=Pseudomonas phage phiPMW TaxID=1815582 RepID=A0A1S5R1A0_9CAUD|nr:hypothetical protein FDG97_gp061 [Pseudomonas phage phiPMW]ANA49186.1 hypothetical protein PMW_61 [Pseudomonas phage phiPMW]
MVLLGNRLSKIGGMGFSGDSLFSKSVIDKSQAKKSPPIKVGTLSQVLGSLTD